MNKGWVLHSQLGIDSARNSWSGYVDSQAGWYTNGQHIWEGTDTG